MKLLILYGSVVCITCILTVLIFLDFRERRKVSQQFQQTTHNAPLSMRILLIAPEQLKVKSWQVGDASVYHLKTKTADKQISFHVAARDTRRDLFWLRTVGLFQFKEVDVELWRLLDKTTLSPGSEQRWFYFSPNAIPFSIPQVRFPPRNVVLEKLGDEDIVTPFGTIRCEHAFAYVRSPDGELEPFLELWSNPAVSPLGLVRARWQDASFDLKVNTKSVPKIPPILLAEFDRNTHLEGSCTRCHTERIGGKNLKLEYINLLSGATLNLTEVLFHHRHAEIVKPDDLMHLHFGKKSKQIVRFSWKKGSFWIQSEIKRGIRLSLDTIAHQGNITVQPSTGRLTLEIQP